MYKNKYFLVCCFVGY